MSRPRSHHRAAGPLATASILGVVAIVAVACAGCGHGGRSVTVQARVPVTTSKEVGEACGAGDLQPGRTWPIGEGFVLSDKGMGMPDAEIVGSGTMPTTGVVQRGTLPGDAVSRLLCTFSFRMDLSRDLPSYSLLVGGADHLVHTDSVGREWLESNGWVLDYNNLEWHSHMLL